MQLKKPIKMKKFQAEIDVMPKKEILDPQGKAVTGSMKNLGLSEIHNVRIGKHISLEIEADSAETAHSKVDQACKNLLANLIMESYSFNVKEIS
jgi:phosphoribosylformylglycinamidine synthase